jgi:hypothetical protein
MPRKLAAVLSLALILAILLAPVQSFPYLLLPPIWFFAGLVVIVQIAFWQTGQRFPLSPFERILPSRAPPAA